jgi:hypothetical protein
MIICDLLPDGSFFVGVRDVAIAALARAYAGKMGRNRCLYACLTGGVIYDQFGLKRLLFCLGSPQSRDTFACAQADKARTRARKPQSA